MIDPRSPDDTRDVDVEADTIPSPPPIHVAHPLPTPPTGWILGVDVSGDSQGALDAAMLRAAGAAFLLGKLTDGEHDIDGQFHATALSCAAAELPCGAYGVLEAYGLKRAAGQAALFVAQVRAVERALGRPLPVPPMLDFELAHAESGLEALRAAVAWRDAVEQALGRPVLVYTGSYFLATLAKYAGAAGVPVLASLARSPLVVASYTGSFGHLPHVPPPWAADALTTGRAVWQAAGGRAVSPNGAGLPWAPHVDVDVDLFHGSVAELLALGSRLT